MCHPHSGETSIKTDPGMMAMIEIADKNIKLAIINILNQ